MQIASGDRLPLAPAPMPKYLTYDDVIRSLKADETSHELALRYMKKKGSKKL